MAAYAEPLAPVMPTAMEMQGLPQPTRSQDEAYIGMLMQDANFASSVRASDLRGASSAAYKFFKHNISQLISTMRERRGSMGEFQVLAAAGQRLSDGTDMPLPLGMMRGPRRSSEMGEGAAGRQRDIRQGEWMVIHSANKSTDPELLGHHGQVLATEHNGWVELWIPKLGRTVKLQQRYLLHFPPGQAAAGVAATPAYPGSASRPFSGGYDTPMAAGPGPGSAGYGPTPGPAYGSTPGMRRPCVGMGSEDVDELGGGAGRPAQRAHHFEGYVPPLHLGQPLPPARGPALVGRAVSKVREVARGVRRELLSLEEVVPWECVDPGWRVRRPAWRKALRALDTQTATLLAPSQQPGMPPTHKALDALIPTLATLLLELSEVLLTDKMPGGPSLFARGGPWETRINELIEGGNSAQCLQHVWDEFHEAARVWLHGQGQALPPSGPPQGLVSHRHHHHHHHNHRSGGGGGGGGSGTLDRGAYSAVLRAFLALESGAAGGLLALSQVAVDRILGLGRDAFAGLKALLAREDAAVAAAVDALAAQPELPGLLGLPAEEVASLSDADVVALLLASPTLRGELRLVRGVDSEPDTDGEDGAGVATDMDDSD